MSASEVTFPTADGWLIGALLRRPDDADAGARSELDDGPMPGIISVPASRHERDAWTQVATVLAGRRFTVLQIDIRGRGASTGGRPYAQMGPAMRRRVALDVEAAVEYLAAVDGVDPMRLGLLLEQDTAADALEALASLEAVGAHRRVAAVALLSARHAARTRAAIATFRPAVYGLVSSEDREGLRATVDAYLAAPPENSRLDVFRGLGVGITIASVLQFEDRTARQIDARLADWFSDTL